MSMQRRSPGWGWAWALTSVFALTGCSDDEPGADAGQDAGIADTGVPDGGDDKDAGEADSGAGDTGTGGQVLTIPGFGAAVEVRFDDKHVPSIHCATDLDCFRAQGYLHAYHRFGQMDLRRRAVRGGISEIAGAAALDNDISALTFFANRNGESIAEQLWNGASEGSRAMVSAYTDGVNAWIADLAAGRNGARLTLEWSAYEDQIEAWEPADSVACVLALIEQLTNQTGTEIARGELFATLPPAMAMDLFGVRPSHPATVLPKPQTIGGVRTPPQLASLQAQLQRYRSVLGRARLVSGKELRTGDEGKGSNNWVVAPSAAAGEEALLANDPHLTLSNPSIWYLVNMHSEEGLHIAGSSFAGLPAVVLGQNENIAWGATTTFFDMADVYLEQLAPDGSGVILDGDVVPFVTREFTIAVARGEPVVHTAYYVPHHGPVVALDAADGTAVTLKWTGQDADTDLDFLLGMARASTVEEARAALRSVTTLGQNFVVADRGGNIGWFPYNRVPNRPWASAMRPSWLPLPGDGSAEWDGFIAYDELPQALNPSEGYLATANNDMTGANFDGDPTNDGRPMLQHFVAAGYRQARIQERLMEGAGQHDLASMQDIQSDVKALIGTELAAAVVMATRDVELSPAATQVRAALEQWSGHCPTGLAGLDPAGAVDEDAVARDASAGCTAFHVLFPRLMAGVFGDELAAAGVPGVSPTSAALTDAFVRPGRLLGGLSYFDDVSTDRLESSAEILARALDSAGQYLGSTLGDTAADWRWGRLHTLTLRADLFDAVGISLFNQGPYANDGGLFTVDVANPMGLASDNYGHRAGASMRFACRLSDAVRCTMELPGGQRHFSDTPTPQPTLQAYLRNEPFELVFAADDAERTAVQRWTLSSE